MLGSATKITYGADWSEYFGAPSAGRHRQRLSISIRSGRILLSTRWASTTATCRCPSWRAADHARRAIPMGLPGPYDPAGLRAESPAARSFDWWTLLLRSRQGGCASVSDHRRALSESLGCSRFIGPGEPWVVRAARLPIAIDGEAVRPTAWVPESKPFVFTEIGFAGYGRGPNQPNVFSFRSSVDERGAALIFQVAGVQRPRAAAVPDGASPILGSRRTMDFRCGGQSCLDGRR